MRAGPRPDDELLLPELTPLSGGLLVSDRQFHYDDAAAARPEPLAWCVGVRDGGDRLQENCFVLALFQTQMSAAGRVLGCIHV